MVNSFKIWTYNKQKLNTWPLNLLDGALLELDIQTMAKTTYRKSVFLKIISRFSFFQVLRVDSWNTIFVHYDHYVKYDSGYLHTVPTLHVHAKPPQGELFSQDLLKYLLLECGKKCCPTLDTIWTFSYCFPMSQRFALQYMLPVHKSCV